MATKITADDKGEVWLGERRKGLGGSDAVVLMGAGQYEDETPYFVWLKKAEGYDVPMNGAMERGHDLEPIVRQKYEQRTGHTVLETGMWAHDEHPVMLGSPDGLVVADPAHGEGDAIGGFEAKTTLDRSARRFPEDGSCPPRFEWQSRHYMAIMDLPWWDVACLVADTWEVLHWRIYRDEAKERALIAACTEFWRTYVEPGIPPEPEGILSSAEIKHRWLIPTRATRDLDSHSPEGERVAALYAERKMLEADMRPIKKRIGEIDDLLKTEAGEHEDVALDGQVLYSWTEQTRTALDAKALKAAEPEIAKRYSKTTTYRVLRT